LPDIVARSVKETSAYICRASMYLGARTRVFQSAKWVGWLRNQGSIPCRSRDFSPFTAYWLVQCIIHPPGQWVRVALSLG